MNTTNWGPGPGGFSPACQCGSPAEYQCRQCGDDRCGAHFCSGCQRCEEHCVCGWRFWAPFDF